MQVGSFLLRTHLAKTAFSSALQFWEPILRVCYRDLIFRDQAIYIGCRLTKWCLRNMYSFSPWGWNQCWCQNNITEPSNKPLFFADLSSKCHLACQVRETLLLFSFWTWRSYQPGYISCFHCSTQMCVHVNIVKRLYKCLVNHNRPLNRHFVCTEVLNAWAWMPLL